MKSFTPNSKNMWYGYRTFRSTKSSEAFDAGNRYSAKLIIILGAIISLAGLSAFYIFPNPKDEIYSLIGTGLMVISAIILIILTENHLKKNFDENGNPKF